MYKFLILFILILSGCANYKFPEQIAYDDYVKQVDQAVLRNEISPFQAAQMKYAAFQERRKMEVERQAQMQQSINEFNRSQAEIRASRQTRPTILPLIPLTSRPSNCRTFDGGNSYSCY